MAEPLALEPRLDLSAAPALHATLLTLAQDDIVLDAADVTHLGALCTQILMAAAQAVNAAGHRFKLVNVSDRVLEQLDVMGLTPESVAEGLR